MESWAHPVLFRRNRRMLTLIVAFSGCKRGRNDWGERRDWIGYSTAITDFVSNVPVIWIEAEEVAFNGGSILHLILFEKNIRCQDTGVNYTS